MEDASNGKSSMSDENIGKICDDIKEALQRQFGSKTKNDKFSANYWARKELWAGPGGSKKSPKKGGPRK